MGGLSLTDLGRCFQSTFVDLQRGFYALHGHTHVFLLLLTVGLPIGASFTAINKATIILEPYRALVFRISDTASREHLLGRCVKSLLQIFVLFLLNQAPVLVKLLFFVDVARGLHG